LFPLKELKKPADYVVIVKKASLSKVKEENGEVGNIFADCFVDHPYRDVDVSGIS
jgi:hypothetical protein